MRNPQASLSLNRYLSLDQSAKVYSTIGTNEKQRLLRPGFELPEDCIFRLQNANSSDLVLSITDKWGVDFTFGSLSEGMLDESFQIFTKEDIMIELGKKDVLDWNIFPLAPLNRSNFFRVIDLSPERMNNEDKVKCSGDDTRNLEWDIF